MVKFNIDFVPGHWPQFLKKGGRLATLYATARLKKENHNSRKKGAIL